ncbi:AsmA family protein [Neolewinella aurantiaca]|nr:hypothetical protein [Neolewinella aurantiaca]
MLKKIVRWLLIFAGVVALLLGLATWWLSAYLDSSQEKILSEFVSTSGLDVTFRELDFKAWKSFPHVTFTIDSMVVRDTTRSVAEPPLLAAQHFSGSLTLGNLIFDTLRLNSIELSHAAVYVASDSLGGFNLGKLTRQRTPADSVQRKGWFEPQFVWSGLKIALIDVDLAFLRPDRNKRMVVHLDSLRTETEKTPFGMHTDSKVAAFVEGIAFNTEKGEFLVRSPLRGDLHIDNNDGVWELASTVLHIRDETFTCAGQLRTGADKGLSLQIESAAVHYDSTLVLLPEELRKNLEKYHVRDRFSAMASIQSSLVADQEPDISVDFKLTGNDVRINQFPFRKVFSQGTFVNELAVSEGGIPGSKKNFRIKLDTSRAYQGALFISFPEAIIRGVVGDTYLDAPIRVAGPARAINKNVGTENFIFGDGRFVLSTYINESLNYMPKIIQSSDGKLVLTNTKVLYKPANVTFPLRHLELVKRAKDVRFKLQSGELSTGFAFGMEGEMDNLLPLLLDRPADSIRTDVRLHAPRISWTDFLAMFGEGGMFASDDQNRQPQLVTNPSSDAEGAQTQDAVNGDQRVKAMKKALLGLQASFRPQMEARFDTVSYYDILAVTNFATGLRFDGDTLVLEQTSFDWEDSQLDFGARLGLGESGTTPFRLVAGAEHLNLNRTRPALEHFGLKLPSGLDSLPQDLKIDFAHRGVINDVAGVRPGDNTGSLSFSEGSEELFSGNITYAPRSGSLHTRLHLEGDPIVVNQLFAAEDFFFGTGRFTIDMDLEGTPDDLNELIRTTNLSLEIDSSRVEYRPGNVFVPIRKFSVHSADEHVAYNLELISDSTRRSVVLNGTLDRLSAFLYPEPGATFRMKANASAQRLHWSDIQGLIRKRKASAVDTAAFNPQDILSATGGIFSAFSPELSLRVDTFRTDANTVLTDVRSGLRLEDSTRLILETSGFRLGEGNVTFSAVYDIDKKVKSPFLVKWKTDSLALGELQQVMKTMNIAPQEAEGTVSGVLSMSGDVVSKMNEETQRVMLDSTTGDLKLLLTDLELSGWPALKEVGRKVKMKKRFDTLRFAPLNLKLKLENGKAWLPRTEVQSTALQLFIEGDFDSLKGPDLLIAVPLRNIGRGMLDTPPQNTGFHNAGWKVYLVVERDKRGEQKMKFRLGRRKYYRQRGRLEELRELRRQERAKRRE